MSPIAAVPLAGDVLDVIVGPCFAGAGMESAKSMNAAGPSAISVYVGT
jgi:hypothetical protein